jgi:hypothetical protein
VDETCSLTRVLGPQRKRFKRSVPSEAGSAAGEDPAENYSQGSGQGSGFLGVNPGVPDGEWGSTIPEPVLQPQEDSTLPAVTSRTILEVAIESIFGPSTSEAPIPDPSAGGSACGSLSDPLASFDEDVGEGHPVPDDPMEEGILLLDASLDEDVEQSPEENIPAEVLSPPSPTIVEGPNWKYNMGDLRLADSEFTPLSSEQHASNVNMLRMEAPAKIISEFKITITQRDILKPAGPAADPKDNSGHPNDLVVDFYLELIAQRSLRESHRQQGLPTISVLPSILYPTYAQRGYKTVMNWTRDQDIFSTDMLIIPIHLGAHWMVMVLNKRKGTLNLHDSLHAVISRSSRARVMMEISRYLLNEHRKKLGRDFRDLSKYTRDD